MPETDAKKNTNYLSWVYWGTLISSLGTFTFPGATIGIMTLMNFPLWQIGLLMGLTRLGTVIGSFFLGEMADKYNTKKVVIWTEVIAFFLSILLIISWHMGKNHFWIFCGFVFLRFVVISVGGPGRNKLVKILSEEYKKSHFHSAVALNLATYGPVVVGSFLGFIAIKYLTYEWVLAFDALTFIINGYILLALVQYQSDDKKIGSDSGLFQKLRVYFSHKQLAILDILLAIPFMGTNVLMSRLSGGFGYRVPLLLMTFGLAVFISSPLLKFSRSKVGHVAAYCNLVLAFIILSATHSSFSWVLTGVMLRNISYWYLFNLYTGTFQEREPSRSVASLFAARTFIGTAVLGIGEVIVGSFGELIDIQFDLGIRAILTALILIIVLRSKDV